MEQLCRIRVPLCAHLFNSPSWLGRYIKARGEVLHGRHRFRLPSYESLRSRLEAGSERSRDTKLPAPPFLYSPECVELEFSEVRGGTLLSWCLSAPCPCSTSRACST